MSDGSCRTQDQVKPRMNAAEPPERLGMRQHLENDTGYFHRTAG